jgi:hypothetical protein
VELSPRSVSVNDLAPLCAVMFLIQSKPELLRDSATSVGTSFAYYGIQGTTQELADSRNNSGFDWIKNITAQSGAKSFTLTDLGLNSTHLAALIGTGAEALDNT